MNPVAIPEVSGESREWLIGPHAISEETFRLPKEAVDLADPGPSLNFHPTAHKTLAFLLQFRLLAPQKLYPYARQRNCPFTLPGPRKSSIASVKLRANMNNSHKAAQYHTARLSVVHYHPVQCQTKFA
jgi:hypothetical protein